MMRKRLLLAIILSAICCMCIGCKEETVDDEHISSYTITYLSTEDTESQAELLADMVEDVYDKEMSIIADKLHTDTKLIYIGGKNLSEQTSADISALKEEGFLIEQEESNFYVYALSDKGLTRAFLALLDCVDEEGNLLALSERIINTGDSYPTAVMVGKKELKDYVIVLPKKNSDKKELAAKQLQKYICEAAGAYIPIEKYKDYDDSQATILLKDCNEEIANTDLAYKMEVKEGIIEITCENEEAYADSVDAFANTYLGYAYAGTDEGHISTFADILRIPYDTTFIEEGFTTWMEEREAIICLWKTNTSRGAYYNGNTSLASEVMTYSDDQLYEYIKMLKYCGFTGIQVTDMCSNWSAFGGYEFVHDRLRTMADAAHSLDMKFTLWVWGAEFTGYGWVDETVTYSKEGYNYSYENPDVVACFDKYYSIYAELADCSDRIIAHYSDPGQLTTADDIGYFAAMLRDKFRSINPDINFGVNCWRDDIDKSILRLYLGSDFVAYEGGNFDNPNGRDGFRGNCNYLGIPFGTWSWNGCEMEIDQLAQMNVNAKLLQNRYQEAVAVDAVRGESTYWSEMDSYHLVNVFSLYAAGHLLQNPFADTDEILRSVAYDTVGETYGESLYEILTLIEDARTGDSYDTFFWSRENYVLKSDDYDADDIVERANKLLPILQEMIAADLQTNVIPLPVGVTELLQLVEPHLAQIQQYATFRQGMDELETLYQNGASKETMQAKVNAIYKPIPEYNCIIGMWGQPEARAQYEMVEDFCQKASLLVPKDETFNYYRKQRIYQEMCSFQKGREDIYYSKKGYYQSGVAFGVEATIMLQDELISEGLLSETEDGYVYVTDWESYKYHFN